MDNNETNKSKKISFKRILITLSIIFLTFTTILFAYLFLSEESKEHIQTVNTVELEIADLHNKNNCNTKNIGDSSWFSYISEVDNSLFYNEVHKSDNIVCNHEIFAKEDIDEKYLIQYSYLHEDIKKVTFFLQKVSEDFTHSQEMEFYIIDLEDNSVNNTGIFVPSSSYNPKYSSGLPINYIVYYPVMYSEGEESQENVYVLSTEGNIYEIEESDISNATSFYFSSSSSPELIEIAWSNERSNAEISTIYNLKQIFDY